MNSTAAHPNSPPVLLVGWDAAESTLVDQLCAAGRLPALQSLRARGCFGILEPGPLLFAGGVWPTFYTGKHEPWHGIYHNRLWRQERMRCETVDAQWLPEPPFWEKLSAERRVAIVDVPMVIREPQAINGINLAGWGTHDLVRKGSYPAALWNEIRSTFGPPALGTELYGAQSVARLLRLRRSLLDATDQVSRICASFLARARWDLFLIVFGAPHRGGHYLWDLTQTDTATITAATRAQLGAAMSEIYEACDRGLARLLEATPQGTKVMVFALHGMGPNAGWSDRLPTILGRIQTHSGAAPQRAGLLFRLKQRLPLKPIRAVTNRIPQAIHDKLLALMSGRTFDWRVTKCFPVEMDHAGYLRINLKGREADGIVNPGDEYVALCDEMEQALLSFRDIGSGQRIVERVYRLDEIAPADAPYRQLLPDLVVTWASPSASASPGVYSERYGAMRWGDCMLPSGRCGNHRSPGWLLAAGKDIPHGARIDGHGIVDLVPTALQWMGEPARDDLQGVVIPALVAT
jgi:predicted AlkP superfamily phosphohydrolase/phosphomutase